jgi:hypothetical protein
MLIKVAAVLGVRVMFTRKDRYTEPVDELDR